MSLGGSTVQYQYQGLDEAFPDVDPHITPLGSRVLVQVRRAKAKTKSGLILTTETRDTEAYNTQISKVVAVGPLAFKNRQTMQAWPEGAWCAVGDYVRTPKYGGDRWSVQYEGEEIVFVIFDDLNIIGKVTGDALAVRAFI